MEYTLMDGSYVLYFWITTYGNNINLTPHKTYSETDKTNAPIISNPI